VTERDAFEDRRRGLEESYFHKKEQELIEKMRRRSEADAARRRMGQQAGVADDEILRDLEGLGYTADTIQLLHLVPFIHLVWADGSVSARERDLIIEAARSRGIASGATADIQLAKWLERRPSDQFFSDTLRAIVAILASVPDAQREASRRDLLSYSAAIAAASGGILGFGAVSAEERKVLERIAQEVEKTHGRLGDAILPPK
jgi:tellurite resistance protein